MHAAPSGLKRWWILIALCVGVLMIALDGTIVIVALPLIQADRGFSAAALTWVINGYLVPFAGFRLLGGRLGDLFGHRRLFLWGILIFTLASLGCVLATSQVQLVAARALQGLSGAFVTAAALSLILNLFSEESARAKAIGAFSFVGSAGSIVGLLLGGLLTSASNWHWIFLINVPIGALVYVLCFFLLKEVRHSRKAGQLDIAGAISVTACLMLAAYAILGTSEAGWRSPKTLALFFSAALLLIIFGAIETRVLAPLIPFNVFRRQRNLVLCTMATTLLAIGSSNGVFASLYLQIVLRRSPLEVSLAFLPANLAMAAAPLGLSVRLINRFGFRGPSVIGLLVIAAGATLFARAPVGGNVIADVLPASLFVGLGFGIAGTPLFLAAVSGSTPMESGLVSAIVSTASVMGSILGLAVLASAATARTNVLLEAAMDLPHALNGGYHVAFYLCAASMFLAAIVCAVFLRTDSFTSKRSEFAEAVTQNLE